MLAELQLRTVAYCRQDLSQDEWTIIIQHMTQSAAALAVLFEDQVHFLLSRYSILSTAVRTAEGE